MPLGALLIVNCRACWLCVDRKMIRLRWAVPPRRKCADYEDDDGRKSAARSADRQSFASDCPAVVMKSLAFAVPIRVPAEARHRELEAGKDGSALKCSDDRRSSGKRLGAAPPSAPQGAVPVVEEEGRRWGHGRRRWRGHGVSRHGWRVSRLCCLLTRSPFCLQCAPSDLRGSFKRFDPRDGIDIGYIVHVSGHGPACGACLFLRRKGEYWPSSARHRAMNSSRPSCSEGSGSLNASSNAARARLRT